jgi:hypothetical protein
MEAPLVTIAIPTFNRAGGYLRAALESALGQTYQQLDVLVSDNCSTDNTRDLVASFSDPRLRYHRQSSNLGQRPNMNFLLKEARGDYFLMFHDDDQIDSDLVESCVNAAGGRRDVGLIVTGSRVIDEHGTVLRAKENHAGGLSVEEFILAWYEKRLHLFLCCCLFNTATLRRVGGFDPRYGHFDDVAAEFQCAAIGGRVDVCALKASFREHAQSGTRSAKLQEWCRSALALLELSVSLASARKKELLSVGKKTSAERNYRHAAHAGSTWERLKAYWTVFRAFGFSHPPPRGSWNALRPLLGRMLRPRTQVVNHLQGGMGTGAKGKSGKT